MEKIVDSLEIGIPKEIWIDSKDQWNPKGILLEVGKTYDFQVLPADQSWKDGKVLTKTCKADGFRNIVLDLLSRKKRSRENNWFALMGAIEKDKTTYFLIGFECIGYSPVKSGELNCFANDDSGHYGNNGGELKLTVTRRS